MEGLTISSKLESHDSFTVRMRIALILFLLAAVLRLDGISELAPQPDETIWLERSISVIDRMRDPEQRLQATTHLGHPGLPPAVLMASSIYATSRFTGKGIGIELDPLVPARVSMAVLASLSIPIVFIGGSFIIGPSVALLAALLLAFDPRHIGLSQLAHLDTALGTFTALAALLFVLSLHRRSMSLEILAGIAWAFAFATKPTASVILIAYVIYRVLYWRAFRSDAKPVAPFGWGLVFSGIAGHVVFALIYTRLWVHRSDYLVRLKVRSHLAREVWRFGEFLNSHLFFVGAVAITLLGLSFLAFRLYKRRPGATGLYHSAMSGGVLAFLGFTLAACPQVYENIVRFWYWVAGLRGQNHTSFGQVKPVTPNGYLDLFFAEEPFLVHIGLGLGLVTLGFFVSQRNRSERRLFLAFPVLLALVWILPLNMSAKQAWRYAIPIMPVLYLTVGAGYLWLVGLLKSQVASKAFAFALVVLQAAVAFQWRPHYGLFFSAVGGGLTGAIRRHEGAPFAGQNEVVDYLSSLKVQPPIMVTTIGDAKNLSYAARRRLDEEASSIRFGYFPPYSADYFLYFATHNHLLSKTGWETTLNSAPEYTFKLFGVPLTILHRVPLPDLSSGLSFPVERLHRHTGAIEKKEDRKIIVTSLKAHDAGFLFFTDPIRLQVGSYRIIIEANYPDHQAEEGTPILDLRFGGCKQVFHIGENSQTLECDVSSAGKSPIRSYWYGRVPVEVSKLGIWMEK